MGPGASLLARRFRVLQQPLPAVDGPPLGVAAFRDAQSAAGARFNVLTKTLRCAAGRVKRVRAAAEFTCGRGVCGRSPAYSRKRQTLSTSLVAESPLLVRQRLRRGLPHEEVAHPPRHAGRRPLAGRAVLQCVLGEPLQGVLGLAQGPSTGPVRMATATARVRRRTSLSVAGTVGNRLARPRLLVLLPAPFPPIPLPLCSSKPRPPLNTRNAMLARRPDSTGSTAFALATALCAKALVVARPAQDNTRGRPPGGGVVRWSGALFPAKPDI